MKRKEFIKSLLGLPLLGLLELGESQDTEKDSPIFTEFKPREFENLYNTTLSLDFPEPDPRVLEELEKIKSNGFLIVDGQDADTKIYEFK